MSKRPQPQQLELHQQDADGGRRTLALAGELDLASVGTLQGAVERMCAERGTTSITIDLRGLTFIDSTGLAAIVLASKLCDTNGFEFALIPGGASTQRLFELTGLIDVLPFRDAAGANGVSPAGREQADAEDASPREPR
jgi:anti-sigma B factor antagonist